MARGRRVNSNGEKSKQLLLEKAIDLFSTNGYHQTKISDIVKAANLTQPTFYLYFQSKEILFDDLNEQFQNDLSSIFSKYEENSRVEDDTSIIQCMLTDMFEYFLENPKLTKIGFYESDQAEQIKDQFVRIVMNRLKQVSGLYEGWPTVDFRLIGLSLLGSVERITLSCLLTNEYKPEQLAKEIMQIYFVPQKELA